MPVDKVDDEGETESEDEVSETNIEDDDLKR